MLASLFSLFPNVVHNSLPCYQVAFILNPKYVYVVTSFLDFNLEEFQ